MRRHRRVINSQRGLSLLEVLASMAILAVIVGVLSATLSVSLNQFRGSTDSSVQLRDARYAFSVLQDDLSAASLNHPQKTVRIPQHSSAAERQLFGGRLILPIEIDRVSGQGFSEERSFQNAVPKYSSLLFPARIASSGLYHPRSEQVRWDSTALKLEASSPEGQLGPSLIGYYVAYAPVRTEDGSFQKSMNLYRHLRPAGGVFSDGYADGFLAMASHAINSSNDRAENLSTDLSVGADSACLPRGSFDNASFPFVLASFLEKADGVTPISATQPFPAHVSAEELVAAPSTTSPDFGAEAQWLDSDSAIHEVVFPDEPICRNVVRFEIDPFLEIPLSNGEISILGAEELNQYLSLPAGGEWPALVAPSYLDVTLATVSEAVARQLDTLEDWLIDWDLTSSPTNQQGLRIEKGIAIHQWRIRLPATSPYPEP